MSAALWHDPSRYGGGTSRRLSRDRPGLEHDDRPDTRASGPGQRPADRMTEVVGVLLVAFEVAVTAFPWAASALFAGWAASQGGASAAASLLLWPTGVLALLVVTAVGLRRRRTRIAWVVATLVAVLQAALVLVGLVTAFLVVAVQ